MKKLLFMVCILIFGIHHSQTYYSQNFNTGGLNGWVSKDLDGDGKLWGIQNVSSVYSDLGAGSLISFSWTQAAGVLTPDNLVTSPLINLSAVTAANVYLSFDQATHEDAPNEKYSVYVTTSNVPASITSATPVHTEIIQEGGLQKRVIDLTSFIGQQVYVSFRHYDCTDNYYLIVDNVELKTIADYDVTLTKVSLERYGVVNTDYLIKATVKNNGTQNINNITINWNDGVDHSSVIALAAPLSLGQTKVITHPVAVNYPSAIEKNISVSVDQINGFLDSSAADNTLATKFNIVSQNSPKKVVIEEGTGTWCGYCPRGAVAMHNATNAVPNDFIGITVHNGDPMALTEYNAGAAFSGFPNMNVDRKLLRQDVPADFSPVIIERRPMIVPAALNATATLAGRSLTFNASATFRTNFTNANFRFAAVVIEDEVKGTTSGYNQVNYYAGGSTAMGGYETKPNPVPAADMVYDHVGRMLLGGYAGQVGSVPASIIDGQTVNYTFTANIPTAYNIDHVKVVLLLLDAATGEIANAAGPFVISNNTLGTTTVEAHTNDLGLYPNPAKDYIKINAKGKIDLTIFDVSGKVVFQKSGVEPNTLVSTQALIRGNYIVLIKEKGSEPKTRKLIIE